MEMTDINGFIFPSEHSGGSSHIHKASSSVYNLTTYFKSEETLHMQVLHVGGLTGVSVEEADPEQITSFPGKRNNLFPIKMIHKNTQARGRARRSDQTFQRKAKAQH